MPMLSPVHSREGLVDRACDSRVENLSELGNSVDCGSAPQKPFAKIRVSLIQARWVAEILEKTCGRTLADDA